MNVKAIGVVLGFTLISGVAYVNKNKTDEVTTSPQESVSDKETNPFVGRTTIINDSNGDTQNESLKTLLAELKGVKDQQDAIENRMLGYEKSRDPKTIQEISNLEQQISEMEVNQQKLESDLNTSREQFLIAKNNEPTPTKNTHTEGKLGLANIIPKDIADKIPSLQKPITNTLDRTASTSIGLPVGGNFGSPKGSTPNGESVLIWSKPDDVILVPDPSSKTGEMIEQYPVSNEEIRKRNSPFEIAENDNLGTENSTGNSTSLNTTLQETDTKHPIYTIPANSTLFDAVAVNAIIGRVPVGGELKSPFRFKVILGPENLATNGHYIPGLVDVTASGTASGDFVLECARGDIDSLTYTFDDGRIHTVQNKKYFGYITDEWGNQCIPGFYISNFKDYLKTSASTTFLATVGAALADSQVTKVTDGIESSQIVTGDIPTYAAGTALGSSSSKIEEIIEKRMEDAFDAVFLGAGKQVAIHIETQVDIDYDTAGRKIVHYDNIEEFLQ
ncbi:TIGR03752 family integrating conjugative element protein [Vibrio crassostreae]|uniref:TIGR03752 family integrating conjugative element protein n=1 Tax=Vibrio crassostreae TaxID=246167 RepID=UPI001B301348|nr:TIGR03752 family integrating conjugative element protein [Vibrio crassostreae]